MRVTCLTPLLIAGCGAVVAGEVPDVPPEDPNLVAWYQMESVGPALTIDDSTGRGHTGRCVDCPVATEGLLGGALRFNGASLIHVPSTPELEATAGFTVATWIAQDPATADQRRCPINKPLATTPMLDSWSICFEPSGQVTFYGAAAGTADLLTTTHAIAPGTWHHVAIAWDGITKRIVVDGVEDARRARAIDFDGSDIVIGADLDSGILRGGYLGAIDELRIYDRALTNAEIAELAMRP